MHLSPLILLSLHLCIYLYIHIQETIAFLKEFYPDWVVEKGVINLMVTRVIPKSEEIPSNKLIDQQLTYANELERIV